MAIGDFPRQSTPRYDTVVLDTTVTIKADAAAAGASNPSYTNTIATGLLSNVRQTSGGEIYRGVQCEAITSFVVLIRNNVNITLTAKLQITITSGPYSGTIVYVHRVHREIEPGRPVRIQLHCKNRE